MLRTSVAKLEQVDIEEDLVEQLQNKVGAR